MRKAVALLVIGAAFAPASALAARTLSDATAHDMAFQQARKDIKATFKPTASGSALAPEVSCRRKAGTWVVCKNTIGYSEGGRVVKTCKRTVDVRLRSGKPAPVLTLHSMTCSTS